MMKKSTLLIFTCFLFFFVSGKVFSQDIIAEYELVDNLLPTTQDANVSATPLTGGPGNGNPQIGGGGAFAIGWPIVPNIDEDSWFGIEISPDTGYEMNISDISFGYRSASTGPEYLEVYWSTDGTLINSTRIDSIFYTPATDYSASFTGLDINIPEGETLYLRWYPYNADNPAGAFRLLAQTPIQVEGTVTPVNPPAEVSFSGTSTITYENNGSTDLTISIQNPTDSATSADIVLVSGDASSINGFTTETVVFPAGSSVDQTVTITLTDDAVCEPSEDLVFAIQNVSTGAVTAEPSQYTLTILDDDQPDNTAYTNDFENNSLSEWIMDEADSWTTSGVNPIAGSFSMKHNLSGIPGTSSAAVSLNSLDLNNETTWNFQIRNGNWTTTYSNMFWVYLASDDANLLPASSASGYAVGVNMEDDNKLLTLYRVDNGTAVPMVESAFEWNGGYTVGVEVTRSQLGEWTLDYDTDGGFDNLISAGSAIDVTYTTADYFGTGFEFTQTRAGELWIDDISISQNACSVTYYSQSSGMMDDAIWSETPSGTAENATINRYNNFVVQTGHEVSWQNDFQVNDLNIESGATLTYTGSEDEYTLGVAGNWSNNGTFNAAQGKIRFFGDGSTRSITGSNGFYDLEIALSGGTIQLNNSTDIFGTLLLTTGELDVNGNTLTLKSDASNTAAVGPVANGSISGTVTVERYIQNGINSWRNLAAPVAGATLQDWNDHFTTTGFPGADFPNWPSPANRFPNIKSYDETDLGDREIGWRAATSINNSIAPGQGFWMYIGGSELPNTVDATGTLITGEYTLDLDYTPSLGAYHDGWNLISNVYAATIDWDHPDLEKNGLEDGIWIWNQDVQQYGSYISGVSTHAVNNEIAHSQSFWVHANAGNPSLTFHESVKTNNNNAQWIKAEDANQGIVRIHISGNGYYDETVLVLNEDATTGYEGTHDAMKFFSDNEAVPSLATVVEYDEGEVDLAINTFQLPEGETMSIPLKTLVGANGEYVLSITEFENIPASACLYLEDLLTGETTVIDEEAEVTVNLDTAQTAPRFMIHLSGPIMTAKNDNTCFDDQTGWLAVTGSGDGPWTYTWTNEMEEIVQVTENSFQSDTLSSVAAGSYYVSVAGNEVCGTRGEHLMIEEPAEVNAQVDFAAPYCNTDLSGSVSVALSGGNGSWTVSLMQGEETINEMSTDGNLVEFNGLGADYYTVVAANNCGMASSEIPLFDENITVADFELSAEEVSLQDGGTIMATNTSQNGILYYWEMGDGTAYQTADVNHTYSEAGEYTITMYSTNGYCDDVITKTVTVIDNSVSIAEIEEATVEIWFDGQQINIKHDLPVQHLDVKLTNLLGKTLMVTQQSGNQISIPVEGMGYAPGVYFVSVSSGDVQETRKLMLNR